MVAWLQILVLFLLVVLFTKPMGTYIYLIFQKQFSVPVMSTIEKGVFRICCIGEEEQNWKRYTFSLLLFNFIGICVLFLIQWTQSSLPLNPQNLPDVSWDLSLNTAISFASNTNWQAYSGEQTLSYLTQMVGLTWQNFCAAATGITAFIAFARGVTQHASEKQSTSLGNFWVDLIRVVLYLFLPLSILIAFILVSQGVIQNFSAALNVMTLEGESQILPMGPVASQEAIKMLGTNGGGFFNTNSAHPFENPTPLTNFVELLSLVLLPASLTYTFGKMARNTWHGWSLFAAMVVMSLFSIMCVYYFESQANPIFGQLPLDQSLGNMEGKEVRFGVPGSSLFASLTTSIAGGAVNSMHDSFTPLGGMVLLINMLLGEVVFGSIGMGMLSMLIFVMITVFLAGLMIGRTPEYLGKKIDGREVRYVVMFIALHSILILLGVAAVLTVFGGHPPIQNMGPHGLTEILYAYTSTAQNNGSAFAGPNFNTPWFNLSLAFIMFLGRYASLFFALAIAGSLVSKKRTPPSLGTLPTQGIIFIAVLIGIIVVIGALTFFPILVLGPFLEYGFYTKGVVF